MADIDLKTETPDTSLPATGFLFGADSQASASPSVYSTQAVATTLLGSTTLSGTTITANAPVFDFAQTWNNAAVTFTGAKLNITDTASNAASLLMDLQRSGTSRFSVNSFTGLVKVERNLSAGGDAFAVSVSTGETSIYNTGKLGWTNAGIASTTIDTILTRRGAANLRLGAADAAGSATVTITIATPGVVTWNGHGLSTGTPVIFSTTGALPTGITAGTTYYAILVDTNTFRIATSLANALAGTAVNTSGSQSGTQTGSRGAITQTSSVQSVVAGTTNFPGADKIITGSQGTGTGAGGSLIFQVAPAGSSGTAQNALATALTINSNRSVETPFVIFDTSGGRGFVRMGSSASNGLYVGQNTTGYLDINQNNLGINQVNGLAVLVVDAANTLALKNAANAQEFRVYKTTTGTVYKALRGDNNLIKISGEAFADGAGASAGTLANAPAVGNPTKWIPIDDNGTTRYIPAW
jgi:hypothetical protein